MRTRLSVVALATSLFLAPVSGAQTRDPATADALFREARSLMKQGDHASACPKLADSQRLDPAAGTAINLGDCLEKLGKLADALQSYREALDILQSGDKRIDPLNAQIAATERRAPKLTIKLSRSAPAGTTVSRDGVVLGGGALTTALPVNVGEHQVIVTAPGHADRRYAVTLAEGEAKTLDVEVGAPVAVPNVEVSRPPQQERSTPVSDKGEPAGGSGTQRTLGWVLTGAGVLGLGLGVVELFRWQAADKRVQDQCDATSTGLACANPGKAREDLDAAKRDATISNVALGVGGLAVVSGVVLLMTAPEKRRGSVRVRAGVARGAVGFAAEGTW